MSDASEIRDVARRVRGIAADLRSTTRTVGGAHGVAWQSVGAAQYRKRLSTDAARINALARDVDSLATSLEAYARAVERRTSVLGKAVTGTVETMRELV
ncbi:hypothetical protein IEE94_13045 [Yimella sp. cx-573]|nr:hypothetical protein [Yimella sp. cx-573]